MRGKLASPESTNTGTRPGRLPRRGRSPLPVGHAHRVDCVALAKSRRDDRSLTQTGGLVAVVPSGLWLVMDLNRWAWPTGTVLLSLRDFGLT